jgi:Cu2+-exporting ATPase
MDHPNQHSQSGLTYTCPMHPEIKRDRPGMCPECGMALVPEKKKAAGHIDTHDDHDKHAGHTTASFLTKFWVTLALSVPVFFYSEMAVMLFGIQAPRFAGSPYILLVVGSFIFFYGGWIFLTSAYRELKARLPGMMTLISIAIIAAYAYSIYAVLSGTEHDLLFELSSLITIMLLGHWIEMRSVKGAQGALKELAKLLPDMAEVVRGTTTQVIPISELKEGDIVLVKPGSKVPADGKITEGHSELNESVITGESKPVAKEENDEVIAGSINGDGSLRVMVSKIGESTFLAGVMRLVADAQASKSRLQILSDQAAYYLTIVAVAAGILTFSAWIFAQAGVVFATERLVAVLVIACPHALGLAVPLVASISTTMAARNGLLIRKRLALEAARKVNVILFDKTGTLTKGEFGIDAIVANTGHVEDGVLKVAASVNNHSEHPLAKAMVAEAKKRNLGLAEVKNFERIPSGGAKGQLDGKVVSVGNDRLLASLQVPLEFKTRADVLSRQGKTVIYVIEDTTLIGAIALADAIREESREAIKTLKEAGIKSAMITGDSEDVAKWVAEELGIDEYFAKVLPHEKSQKVKLLQAKGNIVAMVGDGVNDAPALTQADLGIAIGAGTNVAIESASIILMKNDPRDIPKIIKLSKLTYRKMIQNLFWATGYNVAAIPLAAGVLASQGILLQPWLAAVFMSASTVIVAFNAMLLRRQTL